MAVAGLMALGQLRKRRKGATSQPTPTKSKAGTDSAVARPVQTGGQPPTQDPNNVTPIEKRGAVQRPMTSQEQMASNQQAAQTPGQFDTSSVDQFLSGSKKGLSGVNVRANQELKEIQEQFAKAQEGGLTQQEIDQLIKSRSGEQFSGGILGIGAETKAKNLNAGFVERLRGLSSTAAEGGPPDPNRAPNPFMEGNVREQFGPTVAGIQDQMMTQADQQLASDQARAGQAQGISQDVQMEQGRSRGTIGQLMQQGQDQQAQFTQERQALSQQVAQMPDQINKKFDVAIDQFTQKVAQSQGIIDAKESAAMSTVMRGQNAAMSAAVQGIQGNVNNQVAQIQSNPNLTESQKQSMIGQVRLQGATQMAPAVGQTILQFNQLAAQTATSFGQMTTQIQSQGLAGTAALMEAGAQAFTMTNQVSKQLGAQLLNTQLNADNNFMTTQTQLVNSRANIEMAGDQLRAQLLPELGVPYADYATPMVSGLQMDFDLAKQEFQGLVGQGNMNLQYWIAAQQARSANGAIWSSIGQTIGGPIGQGISMLGALGNMGGPQMPGMPGTQGFQPGNVNQFGLDQPMVS